MSKDDRFCKFDYCNAYFGISDRQNTTVGFYTTITFVYRKQITHLTYCLMLNFDIDFIYSMKRRVTFLTRCGKCFNFVRSLLQLYEVCQHCVHKYSDTVDVVVQYINLLSGSSFFLTLMQMPVSLARSKSCLRRIGIVGDERTGVEEWYLGCN